MNDQPGRRRFTNMSDKPPERLPPHNSEAEQGVLGCCINDPNFAMPHCLERLRDGYEVFYDLRHQTIYEVLTIMYSAGTPIDIISISVELNNRQVLEEVGGMGYVGGLQTVIPSARNVPYYIDIVLEKYLLRQTVRTCTDAVGRIYDYEGDANRLIDEVEGEILKIRKGFTQVTTLTIKELIAKAINTIEDLHARQGVLVGLSTGFADLDKMTGGLKGGEMIVLAARPSIGKTSLAMNITEHVVIEQRLPVGVFSLEMTAESLALRMLCSRARVNIRSVAEGFLAERDFPKLTGAAGKISASPLYIDDSSGLSILQLRAKARRMHQQHGIKLFVIDYLQLLHSTARGSDKREREIADISSGIKSLAKELDVPIIVISQLNRELEKEKNRKPRMSDIRESGSIENDADLIGLLYRVPSAADEDEGPRLSDAVAVNLFIAKQRSGPADEDVHFTFLKSYTRFEAAAKVTDEDVAYQDNAQGDLV